MAVLTEVFTVPANTLDDGSVEQELALMAGNLEKIEIGFQDGCNTMVKISVYHRMKQLVPYLEGQVLRGNDHIFSIPVSILLTTAQDKLLIKGSSPGTNYQHEIYVWLYFTEDKIDSEQSLIDKLFNFVPYRKEIK